MTARTGSPPDSLGLRFLLWYATFLAVLPPVGLFVTRRTLDTAALPTVLGVVVLVPGIVASVVLRAREDAVRAIAYGAPPDETVWGEIVSFAVVCVAAAVGTAYGVPPLSDLVAADAIAVLQLLLSTGLGLMAVGLHRRGTIELPEWMRAGAWGFWDYLALFGAIVTLSVLYATAVLGPASGVLAAPGLVFATVAVWLRRRSALVPGCATPPSPRAAR